MGCRLFYARSFLLIRLILWPANTICKFKKPKISRRAQVLLLCIVLQADAVGFANESVTIEAYGAIQTTLTLSLLPVVAYYLLTTCRSFVGT